MHCCLYNADLANRKTQYKQFGHSVDYFEQQNCLPEFKQVWTEYKKLGSHTLQATLKRVDFAFTRFFKKLSKYPKFKSSRRYRGWTYPCKSGWKVNTNHGVNGYLELRDLGLTIQIRGKARTWGISKTCTVVWDGKHWYASITVECVPNRKTGSCAIGLDFGFIVAVATSDGELIESPKFLKRSQDKITTLSKGLRRKRKPEKKMVLASRRWKKQQAKISKLKRQIANQRQDWTHKVAAHIVSNNSLVVTEKLNLKGMTRKAKKGSKRKRQKSGLNRNLLDVAIGMVRESIKYKMIEAGGVFLEAPTQKLKPTQRCNHCWELTPKTLSDRVHVCSHCSHVEDRDINSAQVCLTWARGLEQASLDVESPSSTSKTRQHTGSLKQLGALKRQKPQSQPSADCV